MNHMYELYVKEVAINYMFELYMKGGYEPHMSELYVKEVAMNLIRLNCM